MMGIFKQWGQRLNIMNHRNKKNQISSFPSLSQIRYVIEQSQGLSFACYTNRACEDTNRIETRNSNSRICECSNCTALPNLTECGVCLEPLQGHRIESCSICSNLICRSCASRLASCAFCRTALPMQRNRALERLLDRLILPCKNSRYGCEVLLSVEHRFEHEEICNFSIIMCPQGLEYCSWRGSLCQIASHMRTAHKLEALQDVGVSVEIYNFRKKAEAVDGRQYTICLACHDQLFYAKITVFKGRLKISCIKLGYTKIIQVITSLPKYGVSIKIHGSCKSMKGVLPFEKHLYDTREIVIKAQRLYSNVDDIDEKDLVRIDLSIKQVNKCS
ncbi:E3 ubiquitin-protein ligase SIAH1B-like isoform X2 [Belonocnema kinseyi]|uniref:E3 ubiquitin-protein ligase SIAH1B-like isoform X2 n=1 Tax=Belonocnema kinseyi TaxID=2817044 RepID=UPI00143D0070|nr:E3 ubiquitin-protein ligase SIAH1B-like isoform X2 [Belonocnema kinseyi]